MIGGQLCIRSCSGCLPCLHCTEVPELWNRTDCAPPDSETRRWLLADAQAGDILYLHYSGHGSQVDAMHFVTLNSPNTLCARTLHVHLLHLSQLILRSSSSCL